MDKPKASYQMQVCHRCGAEFVSQHIVRPGSPNIYQYHPGCPKNIPLEEQLLADMSFQHILKLAPMSQRSLMAFELARYFTNYQAASDTRTLADEYELIKTHPLYSENNKVFMDWVEGRHNFVKGQLYQTSKGTHNV